jgi:methyl-accepting chemotaxis protein
MKFNLFRLDTINKKLLLPTLLLVTILISALGSVLVAQQHRELSAMMESKANGLATMLATISVQYVFNYDLSALESFVRETVKDKEIAFAEYYDAGSKSLTGDVIKAPADTSQLMVYERNILGADGRIIGKVKVGYETSALDWTLRNGITIVVASLIAVLGLLTLRLALIVRSVAKPLRFSIEIAKRVIDGDLTQRIEVKIKDEVGQLMQAMKDMNASLTGIVTEVRGAVDNLSSASEEVSATAQSMS